MNSSPRTLKLIGICLSSILLSSQVASAETTTTTTTTKATTDEAVTNPVTKDENADKSTLNTIAKASQSVYRLWIAVPINSTMLLRHGFSEDDLDKLNSERFWVKKINNTDLVFFKSNDNKTYAQIGHGSGYAITDDGVLVSNQHVTAQTEEDILMLQEYLEDEMTGDPEVFVITTLKPRLRAYRVDYIDSSYQKDLALIKANGLTTIPLKIADNAHVQQAQDVFAIGFPAHSDHYSKTFEDPESYVKPVISNGILKRKFKHEGKTLWEQSATISQGNSGGPIVNKCGEVVGTNQSGLMDEYGTPLANTAGAVALEELIPILDSNNIKYEKVEGICNPNKVSSPNINESKASQAITPTKQENAIDSQKPSELKKPVNSGKVLGIPKNIFYIGLGIFLALVAIIGLLLATRKTKSHSTPISPNPAPGPLPNPRPIPDIPQKTDVIDIPTQAINTVVLSSLKSDYPIKLRQDIPFIIGRDPNSDLVISESKVSSKHVKLLFNGQKVEVTDLQSTNGTFINNRKVIGSETLNDGDVLSLTNERIASWQFGNSSASNVRPVGEMIPINASLPKVSLYPGQSLVVGRNSNNDIVIPKAIVSGEHCVIKVHSNGDVFINDKNSTNGTFIDSKNNRVNRAQLINGQILYFGDKSVGYRFNKI